MIKTPKENIKGSILYSLMSHNVFDLKEIVIPGNSLEPTLFFPEIHSYSFIHTDVKFHLNKKSRK